MTPQEIHSDVSYIHVSGCGQGPGNMMARNRIMGGR